MFTDESLLSSDFDPASYLRHALQVSSTSFEAEQLRLSRCLEKIETEIHATVQNHRAALIGSVQEVSAAQRTTTSVLGAVDQLESSVRRLRHSLHEPYLQMQQRVNELRNVHSCLSLVRNVQRYLNVANKLKEQAAAAATAGTAAPSLTSSGNSSSSSSGAGGGDIVRAARLLREVEEVQASCDLTGIPIVDSIAPQVNQAAQAIRLRLADALRSALNNSSPGELSVSLQCATSTGTLSKTVQGLLAEVKRETSRALVRELDNASTSFGAEMDAEFRNAIFAALDRALLPKTQGSVALQLRSFGLLWTVLRRKRDPATDTQYWWLLPVADRRSFETLWTSVVNQIKERLSKLSRRGAVLVAVATDYGRLNVLLREFLNSVRETLCHVHFDGDDVDDAQMTAVIDDLAEKLSSDFEPRFKLSLQDRLKDKMSSMLSKLGTMRPGGGGASIAGGAGGGVESTPIDIKAEIRFSQPSQSSSSLSGSTSAAGAGLNNAAAAAAAAATRTAPALAVHPAAAPIDPRAFFKTVANEVTNARSDDGVLALVMRAVCDEIEIFTRRCNEVLKPLPVPDLPRVSAGHTTAGQLFHIQLANAASAFVLEMQALGTLFPVSSSSSSFSTSSSSSLGGGGAGAQAQKSPALDRTLAAFGAQVDALVRFQQQIILPYFNAGSIVLLQAVDSFVQDYYERGSSRPAAAGTSSSSSVLTGALAQTVRSRIADFAARYALLFDARAGTVAARACHSLADKVLQRFVARMLLRRGTGSDSAQMRKFVVDDCNALQDAVSILHPLDRLARRLSQVRAIRSLAQAKDAAELEKLLTEYTAARFHPAVVLLAAVQQLPAAAAPSLASQLKVTQQQVAAIVEVLLSAGGSNSSHLASVLDTPSTALPLGVASSNAAATAASLAAAVGGTATAWDQSKWTVLWEACNVLVADAERGNVTMQPGEAPLCDPAVAKFARKIVDSLRNV